MSFPPSRDRPQPDFPANLLVISPSHEYRDAVRRVLAATNWQFHEASTCSDAGVLLHAHHVAVVICESALPDGDWRTCLDKAGQLSHPPSLIVATRLADEHLWAEVLNLGGYDVLTLPFDMTEVFRVTHSAWLAWKRHQESWPKRRNSPKPAKCSAEQPRHFYAGGRQG